MQFTSQQEESKQLAWNPMDLEPMLFEARDSKRRFKSRKHAAAAEIYAYAHSRHKTK